MQPSTTKPTRSPNKLNRRIFAGGMAAVLLSRLIPSGRAHAAAGTIPKLEKSKSEWKKILSPEQFHVLFEAGTERSHTSPLNDEKRPGQFICAACHLPLFSSTTKYESGTGWPSFYDPIAGHIDTSLDFKLIYPRTEYHCVRCGGHQGHVFDDGPPPTGKRYCNNGIALLFVAEGDPVPELRQ